MKTTGNQEKIQAATDSKHADKKKDLDAIRPDLAEVIERYAVGLDERRPDAVARRQQKKPAYGPRECRKSL